MENRFTAVLILFLMTLAQISTDIYLPSFLAIKQQLGTTDTYIQLLIQETLHLSALHYGWCIFFVAISFILGTLLNLWLLNKRPSAVVVKYGLMLTCIASLLLLILGTFTQMRVFEILIPIFILQMGCALIFPSNAAKSMAIFPRVSGKASAIFGCSIFLGGALSSIIMSLLPINTLLPLVIFILVLNTIMVISYQVIIRHEPLTKLENLL